MRDKLIDIVKESLVKHIDKIQNLAENVADELLAVGVIVLPFKVGQMVYVPWFYEGQQAVATVKVEEIRFYASDKYMFYVDMESDDECFNQSFGGWKVEQSIGKTVFLTREEAEQALKEAQG